MNSVFGVPAHPLMVHIPVVMIPLTLVLALLAMVLPRTARGASLGLLATATIGMIGAQLAVMSGEDLEHRVEESSLNHDMSLIHDHAELGEMTRTISFFVFLAAVAFAWRIWNDHLPERFRGVGTRLQGRTAGAVVLAALLLTSALCTVWAVRTGHVGAKAAWGDLPAASATHGSDD